MKRLTLALMGLTLIVNALNAFIGKADAYEGNDLIINMVILSVCLGVLYLRCTALDIPPLPILVALIFAASSFGRCLFVGGGNFALLCFVLLVAFLTAKPEWGKWSQFGALAVFVLWTYGNGSFVYGYLLIQTRFMLELAAKLWERGLVIARAEADSFNEHDMSVGDSVLALKAKSSRLDVSGWFLTTIAACFVLLYRVIVLEPLPRTLSGEFLTIPLHWPFPLSVHRNGLEENGVIFIIFLACALMTMIIAIASEGLSSLLRRLISRGAVLMVMELVVSVTSALLAFRNKNLTVLAAFALVPLAALLMNCALESLEERFLNTPASGADRVWGIAAALSGIVLFLLSFHFL